MKTLIFSTMMLSTVSTTQALAESWTWAPIRDGATLNAHLANFECIQPKKLPVFEMIENISGSSAAGHKVAS